MKTMTAEEFNTVEKLTIVKQCYVDGKFCKKGTVVEKAGNDKVELLASKKAVRKGTPVEEEEDPKGKGK